jgi:FAD/FMN-containing dehydrogenase
MAHTEVHATGHARTGNPLADELQQRTRGEILAPGHDRYEASRRIWNGMIDRRPALIARCAGAADVMACVRFASERKLPVSVRGGGHNVAGGAVKDGGLMIDLSGMRAVRVDRARSTARVGGGALLGDIDHETQAFGLALPQGVVSRTGIGGLALNGGLGLLSRRYGLTADHLVAADVVTGTGELLEVDERRHPDLLWALRGGGSLGAVTSFEFQLRPVGPEIWVQISFYPVAKSGKVMRFFRETMPGAADELMALAIYWNAPHDDSFPAAHRGVPVIVLAACWSGPLEQGEAALRPFREVDTPIAVLGGRMPYLAAQQLFDPEYPDGRRYYWKSTYLRDLGDEAIALLDRAAASRPSPLTSIDVWALGGALSRTHGDHGAFFQRQAPFMLGIEANWDDPAADPANVDWARRLYDDAQAYSTGGVYLNFPGFLEGGEEVLERTFGPSYPRLREVRKRYDPNRLFG